MLFPGVFIPFLGPAYSRACEYTCNQIGYALNPESSQLTKGLLIFGAGFMVMFFIGLIGGYAEPKVQNAAIQQYSQDSYAGRFEFSVKNVASTKMKVQGNTMNRTYEVDQKYQKVADLATETSRFAEDEKQIRAATKKHL